MHSHFHVQPNYGVEVVLCCCVVFSFATYYFLLATCYYLLATYCLLQFLDLLLAATPLATSYLPITPCFLLLVTIYFKLPSFFLILASFFLLLADGHNGFSKRWGIQRGQACRQSPLGWYSTFFFFYLHFPLLALFLACCAPHPLHPPYELHPFIRFTAFEYYSTTQLYRQYEKFTD